MSLYNIFFILLIFFVSCAPNITQPENYRETMHMLNSHDSVQHLALLRNKSILRQKHYIDHKDTVLFTNKYKFIAFKNKVSKGIVLFQFINKDEWWRFDCDSLWQSKKKFGHAVEY